MYGRGRGLRGPVGVGWCACDNINHVHAHLAGVGWVSVYNVVVQTLSWGGVDGHGVNLRDHVTG